MVRKGPRKAQDSAMPMLMSMSRALAPALAAACILAGCGFGAGRTAETANVEPRDVPAVEALPARVGTLPLFEDLSGMVRARNQVVIHPEISASVEEVLVRNGDSVTRGQVLVRLEILPPLSGLQFYKLRLYPYHPLLRHPLENGLILWI